MACRPRSKCLATKRGCLDTRQLPLNSFFSQHPSIMRPQTLERASRQALWANQGRWYFGGRLTQSVEIAGAWLPERSSDGRLACTDRPINLFSPESSGICISSSQMHTKLGLTNAAAFSTICIKSSVFGLFRDWSTIIISSVFELAAAALVDQHVARVNS